MADDNQLQVTFGAKTEGLVQGAKEASAAVSSVTTAVNAQASPLKTGTAAVDALAESLEGVSTASNITGTAVAAMGTSLTTLASASATGSAGLARISEGAQAAGHSSTGFYRELIVLGHEMLNGNYTRFGGSLLVLGERSGNLGTIISGVASVLANPFTLAIVAAGAAIAVTGFEAETTARQMNSLKDSFVASGRGALFDPATLKAYSEQLRDAGVGAKDTAQILGTLATRADLTADTMRNLVAITGDYARVTGQDSVKAFEQLLNAIDKPSQGLVEINQHLGNFDIGTRKTIETMVQFGQTSDAAAAIMERVQERTDQAGRSMTFLQSQLKLVRENWTATMDAIARTLTGSHAGAPAAVGPAFDQSNDLQNAMNTGKFGTDAQIPEAEKIQKAEEEAQRKTLEAQKQGQTDQLQSWEAHLSDELEAQNLFGEKAKTFELQYWQQKKSAATEGTEEYRQISAKVYELQSELYDKDLQASKESERQKTEAAKKEAEERNTDALKHFDELAALYKDDYAKYVQIEQQKQTFIKAVYGQESAQAEQQQAKLNSIEEQHLSKIKQQWTNAFSGIASSVNSGIMGMIQRTETFGQAVGNVFLSMGQAVFGVLEDIAEMWLITELVGETASQSQAHTGIAASAGQAGAAAYASIAAIPIIGPALAPAAGAAAYTGAIAYEALASFDVGSWSVPGDMVANIHQGEMIIPRTFADDLRSNGGALGSGGDTHIHIHATDADSFTNMLRRNPDAIAGALAQAHRNGNRDLRAMTR